MGEALGKSIPSIAATGLYAGGAKKIYDSALGSEPARDQSQYMFNSYGA
jgi:hypothetical protein